MQPLTSLCNPKSTITITCVSALNPEAGNQVQKARLPCTQTTQDQSPVHKGSPKFHQESSIQSQEWALSTPTVVQNRGAEIMKALGSMCKLLQLKEYMPQGAPQPRVPPSAGTATNVQASQSGLYATPVNTLTTTKRKDRGKGITEKSLFKRLIKESGWKEGSFLPCILTTLVCVPALYMACQGPPRMIQQSGVSPDHNWVWQKKKS